MLLLRSLIVKLYNIERVCQHNHDKKWFLLRDVYLNENSLEDYGTIIHSIIQRYIVCYIMMIMAEIDPKYPF